MYVALDDRTAGLIVVADTLRPESRDAVTQLEALGLEVWMLTGDNRATAEAVAHEAGVQHVLAEVLPAQKADKIRELQVAGKTYDVTGQFVEFSQVLYRADRFRFTIESFRRDDRVLHLIGAPDREEAHDHE